MKLSPQETPHNQAIDSAESILQEKIAYPRIMLGDEAVVSSSYKYDPNIMHETDDHSNRLVEPSEEAIDLIGAIDNQTQCRYQHNNHTVVEGYVSKGAENMFDAKDGMRKSSTLPLLELSLRRTQSDGCQNQEIEVKYGLNHSNASAFSWCVFNIYPCLRVFF